MLLARVFVELIILVATYLRSLAESIKAVPHASTNPVAAPVSLAVGARAVREVTNDTGNRVK